MLAFEGDARTAAFFLANAVLSAISDNVFVATVYINEVYAALQAGEPREALTEAEAGLALHTGNTAVRQRLLVLKGDALVRLGDLPRAQAAYQQAVELAATR